MPKTAGMRVVKPLPSAIAQHRKIREKLRVHLKALGAETAKEYGNLSKDWHNKPQWTSKVTIFRKGLIVIRFIITNKDTKVLGSDLTVEELFNMWERTGAKRHDIRPKGKSQGGADVLRFEIRGDVIYTQHVNHPGFEPRNKTPEINRKAKAKVPPLLVKSVQEGLQ